MGAVLGRPVPAGHGHRMDQLETRVGRGQRRVAAMGAAGETAWGLRSGVRRGPGRLAHSASRRVPLRCAHRETSGVPGLPLVLAGRGAGGGCGRSARGVRRSGHLRESLGEWACRSHRLTPVVVQAGRCRRVGSTTTRHRPAGRALSVHRHGVSVRRSDAHASTDKWFPHQAKTATCPNRRPIARASLSDNPATARLSSL